MITENGVYDVTHDDYHRTEICDAPSISSSGLRSLLRCPAKYWWNSPMNPNRPAESDARHFSVGRAAHDLVLDGVGWPSRYHVLPEGFDARATKKWQAAIDEKLLAEVEGRTVLRHDDWKTVKAMAAALKLHPISKALGRGKAELTLAWKDKETGVWLRCRPDFLPDNRRDVPDYKTTADASPDAFSKDVASYGYHMQAALYLDGVEAVFGDRPRSFFFIVQEKEPPYIVQPYFLDAAWIEWGAKLNRKAVRLFARCVERNEWPAYSGDVLTAAMPRWYAAQLEQAEQFGEFNEGTI